MSSAPPGEDDREDDREDEDSTSDQAVAEEIRQSLSGSFGRRSGIVQDSERGVCIPAGLPGEVQGLRGLLRRVERPRECGLWNPRPGGDRLRRELFFF